MSVEKLNADVNNSEDTIVYKKEIGKGSYGEVWSAVWNGSEVAAKRIHEEFFRKEYGKEITDHFIGELRKEWEVLRDLDHQNIVKMHTVLFPLNKSPVIVMELMHCDLEHYIKKSTSTPKVSPSEVLSISLGVAEGLEYLHGMNPPIVHRDLATKNILLTADGRPKIADLGVAKVFVAGKDAFATVGPGTPIYSAPETYLDIRDYKAKYGVKADIFSFGVVLLVIIVGHEPIVFPPNPIKDGRKIPEVKRRENDIKQIQNHMLKQVVLHCLEDESSSRPHAHEIVKELHQIKQRTKQKSLKTTKGLAVCDSNVTFESVSSQPHYDHEFKVLFLGSSAVGKTCLLQLLKNPTYDINSSVPTVGVPTVFELYKYNSSYVKMVLTDTAGQEDHFSIPPIIFRPIDGAFLVYDVADYETFEMLPYWMEMLEHYAPETCKVLLVGNKVDLREINSKKFMVPQTYALEFAHTFGFPYVETSAKDIDSIMNMMHKMVEILMSTVSVRVEDVLLEEGQGSTSVILKKGKKKKGRCSLI